MIHLSSYHSNGLPAVVWQNKVNLIGEKVYKPKIHFCEQCNKPILIYGRLIPCKHVFCFSCATLCLTQQQQQQISKQSTTTLIDTDESTSNTSLTNLQQDATNSPNLSGASGNSAQSQASERKGCYRCGNKALRVERNMLNSIYVCQVETCRRTYLSARDLQAHVAHRHNKHNKSSHNTSASLAAISSSPYISSSTLMHLGNHNNQNNATNNHNSHHQQNHRHSSSAIPASNTNSHANNNSPNQHYNPMRTPSHHRDYSHRHHQDHDRDVRDCIRDRHRDRDNHPRDKDSKEYHRQSIQRAAQWAEASAQIMEKGGLTR